MTLNKAKGRMFKSVGWTWNPITGCTHGCPYCWAKSLADRWGKPFHPQFREHFLNDQMPNDGTWIFVGSTGDIFCEGVKDEWLLKLLYFIEKCRADNKFLLQTKNPFGFLAFYLELDRIKDKIILGTTLESTEEIGFGNALSNAERYKHLADMKKEGDFKTFLSLEPLADFSPAIMKKWIAEIRPEAVEIGWENYTNFLNPAPEYKILMLTEWLDKVGIPYVLKENLRHLEGELLE